VDFLENLERAWWKGFTFHASDKHPSQGSTPFHPIDKDLSQENPAFHPIDKDLSLGTPALKGHGFSRAAARSEWSTALAAEGMQISESRFPQGLKPKYSSRHLAARLKPRPFKTSRNRVGSMAFQSAANLEFFRSLSSRFSSLCRAGG
jgi:hypothetical protein